MGWATAYIAKLKAGETVSFRPRGGSMTGKVSGNEYLHLVKAIQGQRFQIGNNRGFINGWVGPNAIYGRCIKVEA